MAAWKPWQEDEYKDLYSGGGSSFVETFLKAQDGFTKKKLADAQAEEAMASIEDKKQARASRSQLAEALRGATPDKYSSAIRDSLASLGDVEGLMNLEQVQAARADKQRALEDSQLEAVTKLAAQNPDLAAEIWNKSPLAQRYGMRTPESLYKPEVKSGAGALYTVGPDGEIDIKYKQERRTGSGSKSSTPGLKSVYDPESKQNVYVNPKDPEVYARLLKGELLPPKTANASGSDWDALMGAKEQEEKPVERMGPRILPPPQGTIKTRKILKTGLGGFGG